MTEGRQCPWRRGRGRREVKSRRGWTHCESGHGDRAANSNSEWLVSARIRLVSTRRRLLITGGLPKSKHAVLTLSLTLHKSVISVSGVRPEPALLSAATTCVRTAHGFLPPSRSLSPRRPSCSLRTSTKPPTLSFPPTSLSTRRRRRVRAGVPSNPTHQMALAYLRAQ